MGKNFTFWLNDESEQLLGNIDGKGTLLNQLIKDHFSNDIEILKVKASTLNLELEQVNNKIQKIRENADLDKKLQRQKTEQTEAQRQKKAFVEYFNSLKDVGKISIDEWSECFDINGIILEKAKGLLNGKNIRF